MPQPQVPVNPVPVAPSPVLSTQPPSPKIFPLNLILIILIIVVIFSTVIMSAVKNQANKQTPKPSPQTSIKPSSPLTPTPTTDPTANWKTYKDEKYKFQFRYPPTVYLKQSPKFGDQIFLTENDIDINEVNEGPFALVTVAIWNKNEFQKAGYPQQDKYLKSENIIIDGVNAVKVSGIIPENQYLAGTYHQEVSFSISDKIIQFVFYEDPVNNIKLLDQILSTFKFIDSNQKSAIIPKDEIIQNDKECADGICILKIESGQSCGRITDAKCPTEYTCELDSSHPDAGGKCVKE